MVGLILQSSILMMALTLRRKPLYLLQRRKKPTDKVDASKIDMPVHPVKAPVITHEKLEETAKTTDNEELKK